MAKSIGETGTLHPLLAAAVEKRRRGPQHSDLTVAQVRELARSRLGAPDRLPALHSVRDLGFPGVAGPVPARLYTPSNAVNLPLIVYFHGGGFVTGDLDTHDSIIRQLAVACDAIVLSVDYRLAPEHPFPAGVEDAEAALKFAILNASTFNADPDAIFASGDSAGGALAIAAAPVAPDLAGLLLFYPVTDLTHIGKSESYRQFSNGSAGLSENDMQWLANHYTPDGPLRQDWRCSPLLAGEDTRFPPVFIATAQFDVLRSEGEAFAKLMSERGVATEHYAVNGVNHGFLGAGTAVPQVIATYAAAAAWLASIATKATTLR